MSLQVGEAFATDHGHEPFDHGFGSELLGSLKMHDCTREQLGPSASPFTLVLRQAWRRQANPHVP